jgi:hypothetical protein
MTIKIKRFMKPYTADCRKTPPESFDDARDERRGIDTGDDFPFMLRFSKHSGTFLTIC